LLKQIREVFMAAEEAFMVAQLHTPHRLLVLRCGPVVFHPLGPGRYAISVAE
jgi:hypothetical protein